VCSVSVRLLTHKMPKGICGGDPRFYPSALSFLAARDPRSGVVSSFTGPGFSLPRAHVASRSCAELPGSGSATPNRGFLFDRVRGLASAVRDKRPKGMAPFAALRPRSGQALNLRRRTGSGAPFEWRGARVLPPTSPCRAGFKAPQEARKPLNGRAIGLTLPNP